MLRATAEKNFLPWVQALRALRRFASLFTILRMTASPMAGTRPAGLPGWSGFSPGMLASTSFRHLRLCYRPRLRPAIRATRRSAEIPAAALKTHRPALLDYDNCLPGRSAGRARRWARRGPGAAPKSGSCAWGCLLRHVSCSPLRHAGLYGFMAQISCGERTGRHNIRPRWPRGGAILRAGDQHDVGTQSELAAAQPGFEE